MSSTRELGAAALLSRDEIRAFTRPSNAGGAVAIAWTWTVIAGCAVARGYGQVLRTVSARSA